MPPCPALGRPRVGRVARLAATVAVAVLGLVVTLAVPAAAHDTTHDTQTTTSVPAGAHGASTVGLTAADRDFTIRVRLAGLWEMPAGQLAASKGSSPRVRVVGRLISEQHARLDQIVVEAAARLGVQLPDQPTVEQQYWLREMRAASGPAFDRIFVQRLREAHGKIFSAIAVVRANTRDPVVRDLADEANEFVKTHLTLLESTGLVDYGRLPDLTEPAPDENRFVLFGDPRYPSVNDVVRQGVVLGLLGFAVLLAAVLGVRVLVPHVGHRVVRPTNPAPLHRRHRSVTPPVADRAPSPT